MLTLLKHPGAEKALGNLPKKVRIAIERELDVLSACSHPMQHRHVIKLGGGEDRYRLRVGNYRIKMRLRDDHTLLILEIEHRQSGY